MCECIRYMFFFFSSRRRHTRFKCDWSSDVCSSDLSLLEKYWPKLVRSYASEALNTAANGDSVSVKGAQEYIDQLEGRHEISESEPGVYRHTEIIGDGYKNFELISLLPSTSFEVHISKMTD